MVANLYYYFHIEHWCVYGKLAVAVKYTHKQCVLMIYRKRSIVNLFHIMELFIIFLNFKFGKDFATCHRC